MPSKLWKSSQFSRKIVGKFANYAIYIMTSWYPCVLAVDSYSDSSLAPGILTFILSFLISYVKSMDFTVNIST